MKYAINGKFLSQKITGVQRYAYEIIKELDNIIEDNQVCIVVASDIYVEHRFNHINVVSIGKTTNMYWLQVQFPLYCKKNGLISVNLCGSGPLLEPGIVCMHDIGFVHDPNTVSKGFYLWGRLQILNSTRRAKKVITVSEFSKNDIIEHYPRIKNKIYVVANAWQHMQNIDSDDNIFVKNKQLRKGEYYFTMSSMAKNKNLPWTIETAKLNPESLFVVAGNVNKKVFGEFSIDAPDNVIFLGYVTDGEAKALMSNCKAFLFPTLFEGFGIPPLEAMACGANIVVSDIPVMHEIYKNSAAYIDPQKPTKRLDSLIAQNGCEALEYYSWKKSAMKFKEVLSL